MEIDPGSDARDSIVEDVPMTGPSDESALDLIDLDPPTTEPKAAASPPPMTPPPPALDDFDLVDLDHPDGRPQATPDASPPVVRPRPIAAPPPPPGLDDFDLVDLDHPAGRPLATPGPVAAIAQARPVVAPTPTLTMTPLLAAGAFDLVDLDQSERPRITPESDGPVVTIGSTERVLAEIPCRKFGRDAVLWSRVMLNRDRWTESSTDEVTLTTKSAEVFKMLGLSDDALRAIGEARGGVVEVGMEYIKEDEGREVRVFPWESMLSAATKPFRRNQAPLYVVRHLKNCARQSWPVAGHSLLYVQSIPGGFERFDFDPQRRRVREGLKCFKDANKHEFIRGGRGALKAEINDKKPGLIHIAGFDTWQGAALLGLPFSEARQDGLMFADESGQPDEIDARTLAYFVHQLNPRPWLVSLNLYNSSSRLAVLAVANGAAFAIGFQDVFDNDVAEQFFGRVYEALPGLSPQTAVTGAFLRGQAFLQGRSQSMNGSGVVLWSEQTIEGLDFSRFLKPERVAAPITFVTGTPGAGTASTRSSSFEASPLDAGVPPPNGGGTASRSFLADEASEGHGLSPGEPRGQHSSRATSWAFDPKKINIRPFSKLNYSMLHNRSRIFEKFELGRFTHLNGPVDNVTVRVELYLGVVSPCSWERTFNVPEKEEPLLESMIRLPLISDLQRNLKHTLRTNLKVRIDHAGVTRYRETFSVELLAIDEWRDDAEGQAWLPSFVLPGDPTVSALIDSAQRYLTSLADDPKAGFDGYQRVGRPVAGSPDLLHRGKDVVDPQVRAIWSSIWQEYPLRYINQPPTYTRFSQRIRSPSAVVEGHRGTCIDLALLLASCLEYIDLSPVIFLLRGHALAGYWRDPDSQRTFVKTGLGSADAFESSANLTGGTSLKGRRPWVFDQHTYFPAIRGLIDSGALVPVETTGLTEPSGFGASQKVGDRKIVASWFESMMDVRLARNQGVLPLPMSWENGP